MAHLFKTDDCGYCNRIISGEKHYIHHPALCSLYHNDSADQMKRNRDLRLAAGIMQVSVGGGALAISAGRLATVGKIGAQTSKALGGAMVGLGAIISVVDIVDAATEKAPPLPPCKRCGKPEAENPGCILICIRCGVECSSWRDADSRNHCFQVCNECYNLKWCMKCMIKPVTKKTHTNASKITVHRSLSTELYGTCKDARITGSSLSLAGTAALFIPVVGWIAGPTLLAAGAGTSIGAGFAAKPVVKIKCGRCSAVDEPEKFLESGCEEWCATCGVLFSDASKCCLVLCDTCKQED